MNIKQSRYFKIAQSIAAEAVEYSSRNGGDFDWDCAMLFMKAAHGLLTIEQIEKIGLRDEDD